RSILYLAPRLGGLCPETVSNPDILGFRGFRHNSNFYLDWVFVDFKVRMGKFRFFVQITSIFHYFPLKSQTHFFAGHKKLSFFSAALHSCSYPFACVSFCGSKAQNEEGWRSGIPGNDHSSIWLLDILFCSTLKTSVDSWLQSLHVKPILNFLGWFTSLFCLFGHRARVLCIAQGTERYGSKLKPRRNRGSWVGSNSSANGFKGWFSSDNGKESLDLQSMSWNSWDSWDVDSVGDLGLDDRVRCGRAVIAVLSVGEEPKQGCAGRGSDAGEGDEGEKREGVGDEGGGCEARLRREKRGGGGCREGGFVVVEKIQV
ncbi:hypothetical protein DVH24_008119, partial [Malus domestica]